MSITVSIILICQNKFPEILFTLYSLQKQAYDMTKMQVILVDDSSSDKTRSLKNYKPPFHFKYVRSRDTLGRAGAKNFGLQQAEGDIIIFLDGEVMVDPYFTANHVRHYHTGKRIAVSGTSGHHGIFSVLHPGFSKGQVQRLYSLIHNKPLFLKRLAKRLGIPVKKLKRKNMFFRQIKKANQIIPLLKRKDIPAQRFKKLSYPMPSFPEVTNRFYFDLTGYHLAWTFFITRNVSVRKNELDSVGLFNEGFKGWGYEDWELGFRFYKSGVKIIEDPDIISYHQEHPYSQSSRNKEHMINYLKLVNLHPEIEVCAFTLKFLSQRSFLKVNAVIDEYYLLEKQFPEKSEFLKPAFIKLTKRIPILLSEEEPVKDLLFQSSFEEEPEEREKLLVEIDILRKVGKYCNLSDAFDMLINC